MSGIFQAKVHLARIDDNRRLIDIDQELFAEVAHHVPDCVFGEGHTSKTQSVIAEVILGNVAQLADADLPPGLNVVEALLELTPSLTFGILGDRF
jgi:hypothetical protein